MSFIERDRLIASQLYFRDMHFQIFGHLQLFFGNVDLNVGRFFVRLERLRFILFFNLPFDHAARRYRRG
jgi:hypothetical protein